ncbi:MAG: SDR family NAD(P)-dependent oxidoreductase [Pirellulales bacterium]
MQIEDRSFLVTGASSGLGAATAQHLASRQARVVLADMNESAGFKLAESLGPRAHFVRVDVTSARDVQEAIDTANRAPGGLRGVIHCAGILGAGRVVGREEPYPMEDFARVVEVNLNGTFNVVRLAAAAMAQLEAEDEGERGVIITTASVAAFEGQIGQAAYAAAKAGVAGMTLPIARELGRLGIRVVSIAPGVLETPMMAGMPEKVRQSLMEQVVYPDRLGRPEEFAMLAAHIVENRLLNGTVLRLDGAVRLGAK